jgi:O-acetyl-ADP-ribose deacetylase (regulator of RNase III)
MLLSSWRGDITTLAVDAIVNAANSSLLGGGGVDAAIHEAAGGELLQECCGLGGCPTGEARITGGYQLPAQWVIHTVGPVWQGGGAGEPESLAACYNNCLRLAESAAIETVAFPAISCGVYGYPLEPAVEIAVASVSRFVGEHLREVVFVSFSEEMAVLYEAQLAAMAKAAPPNKFNGTPSAL